MVELRREESRSPAQDLIGPLSFGQLGPKPAVLCLKIDRFCWRATTRGFVLTHPHPQGLFVHTKLSCHTTDPAEAEIERTYQRNSLSHAQAEHVRKVLNDVFDQLEGSSEDERKLLTTQRDKLEAERLKLVQAHYADAIPLDLLKSEQDRIRASLDQITTRLDNLTDTYAEARTGLDQLTDLLVDLNDLYSKREPAKRRTLNRALFTRITIDDEENATYTPEQTTAKVLAHTSIDAPAHITAETKLPRHQAGRVSVLSSSVDLAEGLSKLAPPVGYMRSLHRTIRSRAERPTQREPEPVSPHRSIGSEALDSLERRYHDGEALRAIANDVGLSRHRLASLLRGRGVRIRGASPSSAEVREMARLYRAGESLKRIGDDLGYSAGTIRNHLLAVGVTLRGSQARDR